MNKMNHQITENEENLFFGGKCPDVSCDLKYSLTKFQDGMRNILPFIFVETWSRFPDYLGAS